LFKGHDQSHLLADPCFFTTCGTLKSGRLADALSKSDHFIAVSEFVRRSLVERYAIAETSITVSAALAMQS